MLDKYRALNQIQRNRFIFSNHPEKYTLATQITRVHPDTFLPRQSHDRRRCLARYPTAPSRVSPVRSPECARLGRRTRYTPLVPNTSCTNTHRRIQSIHVGNRTRPRQSIYRRIGKSRIFCTRTPMDMARLSNIPHSRTTGATTDNCTPRRWICERDRVANPYWRFCARAIPHIGILCTPL